MNYDIEPTKLKKKQQQQKTGEVWKICSDFGIGKSKTLRRNFVKQFYHRIKVMIMIYRVLKPNNAILNTNVDDLNKFFNTRFFFFI